MTAVVSRRAVVFAYHNVGVRCLAVLLARGVEVPLVVTHRDSPSETIWFSSVAQFAREHRIDTIYADGLTTDALRARIGAIRPDYLFSFYYRNILPPAILELGRRGAYNLHGSLLPKYRGRVPVNWAVLHGETETGATLHEMTAKPDAGAIVAQTAVPILPDDTAHDVFGKVTVAAELTLWNVLPALLAGHAPRLPNDLSKGSYFGGRKPEDGRIDWSASAKAIHDLVRAVAPPYPGAFTTIDGRHVIVERTRLPKPGEVELPAEPRTLRLVGSRPFVVAGDGRPLELLAGSIDGEHVDAKALSGLVGTGVVSLGDGVS